MADLKMKIFKYKLQITDIQEIEIPEFSNILAAQMQHGELQLWVAVNEKFQTYRQKIALYGTGNEITGYPGRYVSTVQLYNGDLVFHVFALEPGIKK